MGQESCNLPRSLLVAVLCATRLVDDVGGLVAPLILTPTTTSNSRRSNSFSIRKSFLDSTPFEVDYYDDPNSNRNPFEENDPTTSRLAASPDTKVSVVDVF